MNPINNKRQQQSVFYFIVLAVIMVFIPAACWCAQNNAEKIEQPVKESIDIRQESQKTHEKWEQEKASLILAYEKLRFEHQAAQEKNRELVAQKKSMTKQNQTLFKQTQAFLKIKKELFPFLEQMVEQLDTLVANDVPFLKEERSMRLSRLKKMMDDPEVTISEKYRKVMEAIFIEAEYGSTIEVYQEKIKMGGQEVLGNIFRLGRVSLFFLSMDQTSCAYFNVASNVWEPLAEKHLASIQKAVEIAGKRRPVELLSLPLGGLVKQGGAQ